MKENSKKIFITIVILIIGILLGIFCSSKFLLNDSNTNNISKNVNISETNSIKESINKVYNAVVVIETYDSRGNKVGTGTGFVYKKDNNNGYVITNHHVIEEAGNIKVINMDGNEIDGKLLGSDEYSDVAVLSIPIEGVIDTAVLGNSTSSELGDTVFTVGSPLGVEYKGTVTKGILSGKDRQVTVSLNNGSFILDVLQTDAAINPGNSGGPLVNINGEVIGVTSMKLVQDEIEGMGFALPIEMVKNILDDLENGKKIERPLLGIQLIDVDNISMMRNYNLNLDKNIDYGIVVMAVEDNTPASSGGLQKGDVIIKINDDKIENSAYFRYNLYKYNIGDSIKITYIRNGKEATANIKLDKSL